MDDSKYAHDDDSYRYYDVVFGSCDRQSNYYGRTIGLGQQLVGLSYAEAGQYYNTRGLGEGNTMMA